MSLIAAMLLCGFAWAQESTSTAQQQDPNKPAPASPDTDSPKEGSSQEAQPSDSDVKAPVPVPVPGHIEVHAAGSSSPLSDYESFLRWGPVYVRGIEFLQSYDQISDVTGGAQGIFNQGSFNASVLRADIVYDRMIGQNRLEAEYSPRLTIINGRVSSDYLNQTVKLNWVQSLSPRWTLGLSNSVGYFSVRHLYGDYFLDVNTIGSVPSSFLDGGGSWLNANSNATFAYALSPTSSFSISPNFAYTHITGIINGAGSTDAYQYGAKFDWNKQLNVHRSINISYQYSEVNSGGNSVPYQGAYVGITQELSPNLVVSGSVGLVSAGFVSSRNNSFAASVQASRKLGRTVASVGYYRGMPLFSDVASQGLSQFVQGNFRVDLTQRLYWSVQGGYENTLTSKIVDVSGEFISTEVGYRLSPQVSSYFGYGYKTQGGNDPLLLSGTRSYYLGGLRWTARPVQ